MASKFIAAVCFERKRVHSTAPARQRVGRRAVAFSCRLTLQSPPPRDRFPILNAPGIA
jgi:hypothetical protein